MCRFEHEPDHPEEALESGVYADRAVVRLTSGERAFGSRRGGLKPCLRQVYARVTRWASSMGYVAIFVSAGPHLTSPVWTSN